MKKKKSAKDSIESRRSSTHITQPINLAGTDNAANSPTIPPRAYYTLDSPDIGTYQLWVRAIDKAGNASQMGAHEVQVMNLYHTWFPLIANGDGL